MRTVVDRAGLDRQAASASQMVRFETGWLTSEANLAALADLSGAWIDRVHARRPQTAIVLDVRWDGHHMMCAVITPASATRPRHGTRPAGW